MEAVANGEVYLVFKPLPCLKLSILDSVLCCISFVSHYQISDSDVQYALTYVEVCRILNYFQLSLL
jgi:hypothetical protein